MFHCFTLDYLYIAGLVTGPHLAIEYKLSENSNVVTFSKISLKILNKYFITNFGVFSCTLTSFIPSLSNILCEKNKCVWPT